MIAQEAKHYSSSFCTYRKKILYIYTVDITVNFEKVKVERVVIIVGKGKFKKKKFENWEIYILYREILKLPTNQINITNQYMLLNILKI